MTRINATSASEPSSMKAWKDSSASYIQSGTRYPFGDTHPTLRSNSSAPPGPRACAREHGNSNGHSSAVRERMFEAVSEAGAKLVVVSRPDAAEAEVRVRLAPVGSGLCDSDERNRCS